MNKLEQAARQALEALKTSKGQWVHSVNAALCFKTIATLEEALNERPISQEQNCCCEQGQTCGDCDPEAITVLREALDPELQFVRDWNEGKVRRVSDGKVMGLAEQAEQSQLADASLEPVAWVWACAECGTEAEDGTDGRICSSCGYHKFYKAPKDDTYVCAAKAQEQAEQRSDSERMEPVAYHVTAGRRVSDGMQVVFSKDEILYAAPVRTKDLTDDEIMKVFRQQAISASWPDIFRAVIAADREKNK